MHSRQHPPAHYRRIAARQAERDEARTIKPPVFPVGHALEGQPRHLTQAEAREILTAARAGR